MKTCHTAILVFSLLVLPESNGSIAGDQIKSGADLTPYQDLDAGFAIKHPSNWEQKAVKPPTVVVSFVASDPENAFADNMNLGIVHVRAGADIEASMAGVIAHLSKLHPGFKLLKSEAAKMGSRPAHKIVYTVPSRKETIEAEQVGCIVDGRAYILTFETLPGRFDKMEATFRAVASSFDVLPKQH